MFIPLKKAPCLSIEVGTFIFAVINVVVTSLAFISCAAIFLYATVTIFMDPHELITLILMLLLIPVMMSLLALVFAVTLIQGINQVCACFIMFQENPSKIRYYFVYGTVVVTLSVPAAAAAIYMSFSDPTNKTINMVAWGCLPGLLAYTMILTMIRLTYKKLENRYRDRTAGEDSTTYKRNLIANANDIIYAKL